MVTRDNEVNKHILEKEEIEKLKSKLNFANRVAKIGLWEMDVVEGDPVNINNVFVWTEDFRRVLGFSNEKEFPNVLGSWGERIHPEDSERVYKAFADHMTDHSGRTPYNIDYRIKLKNGEYIWVHAEGETKRDKSGVPLRVIGSIRDITAEKLKDQVNDELAKKIEDFSQSINEIVVSIKNITNTAQELAEYQEDTLISSKKMKADTDETQKITEFIKNLSKQTNLLGLNAAIEAARSGREGLGFTVVANEIRKLSLSSSNAVEQIGRSLKDINDSIEKITKNIENVSELTQSQAATTEEVNACAEELNEKARELVTQAKKIFVM